MVFNSLTVWVNWMKMLLLVAVTTLLLALVAFGFNFLMELLYKAAMLYGQ